MEQMEPMENAQVKVNVIKRNGQEVGFDIKKIINAITKANNEVDDVHQMNPYQIRAVADTIAKNIFVPAPCHQRRRYTRYGRKGHYGNAWLRSGPEICTLSLIKREISRKTNTTDDSILALIEQMNERSQTGKFQ